MLCGSLDQRGVWGRMHTCICMAESLCCPPETITTLLISYTPIKNKQFFKKTLGEKMKISKGKDMMDVFICSLGIFIQVYVCVGASQVVLVLKNVPVSAWDMKHGFNCWVEKIPSRRSKQLPTPVFLPGEYHEQRSLVGSTGLQSQTRLKRLSMHACLYEPWVSI